MKKPSKSEPDIFGLLTKLQEQIAALDKKVDMLVTRPQPSVGQRPQQLSQPSVQAQSRSTNASIPQQRPARPLYRIVCADCKKESEIPFKPSGDRPVYCKECFTVRKSSNTSNTPQHKPAVAPPALSVIHAAVDLPETSARDKKKSVVARKPAPKKKPVPAKKKK